MLYTTRANKIRKANSHTNLHSLTKYLSFALSKLTFDLHTPTKKPTSSAIYLYAMCKSVISVFPLQPDKENYLSRFIKIPSPPPPRHLFAPSPGLLNLLSGGYFCTSRRPSRRAERSVDNRRSEAARASERAIKESDRRGEPRGVARQGISAGSARVRRCGGVCLRKRRLFCECETR